MDDTRKKIRVCLICVVAVAVLIGVLYYFQDVYGTSDISEGTLVTISETMGWRQMYGGNR